MPFHPAAKVQDIPENSGVECRINGRSIAIFKLQNGELHAISNLCPHRGASLVTGELRGKTITCPLHAWKYDVTNGKNQDQADDQTLCYKLKVEGDQVFVEMPY